ncbi:MAG: 50S ribosomal protein L15 [Bacteroidetes bacterium]|jgi:large subunit ribosomal protein L15|nr:50S ribosomal protein L15 [Bacteroidota bacterium]MBU1577985.1 50S ribosomal protein L15 [Bacteroidota bacterium]MBU2465483.1 50S ribosomal protein L15 [Bacteroidota bacterium]MBU2556234.1 50S ribosomal protein L15 [Bacteroidota bacterium]MDA3942929.1 50S ribosomal protein L15 [Bacteroidota bacterium]
MDLSNLKPAKGAVKNRKRIGRGQGSGFGGTSTRGHKGAGSRSGNKKKLGFEGGQMPLARRLPKFGFKNINRKEFVAVNIDTLELLAEKHSVSKIDAAFLIEHGLVNKRDKIKVLAKGELKAKLEVKAHAYSAAAAAAIEAAGGTAEKY